MKKVICKYCGKQLDSDKEFCGNDCAKHYEKMIAHDSPRIKYFIFGIIAGIIVMFLGVFTKNNLLMGAGLIIDGITITVLPFVTPETITFLGYKRSRILGRISGIVVIILGIWVGYF